MRPIHYASKYGNKDALALLLDGGADIHSTGSLVSSRLAGSTSDSYNTSTVRRTDLLLFIQDECTALHFAAMGGHMDLVSFLLERGADIKVTDKVMRFEVFIYEIPYFPLFAII